MSTEITYFIQVSFIMATESVSTLSTLSFYYVNKDHIHYTGESKYPIYHHYYGNRDHIHSIHESISILSTIIIMETEITNTIQESVSTLPTIIILLCKQRLHTLFTEECKYTIYHHHFIMATEITYTLYRRV